MKPILVVELTGMHWEDGRGGVGPAEHKRLTHKLAAELAKTCKAFMQENNIGFVAANGTVTPYLMLDRMHVTKDGDTAYAT